MTTLSIGKDVEFFYMVGGNLKCWNHFRKKIEHFLIKLNIYLSSDPEFHSYLIYPREMKMYVHKNTLQEYS